ncbi:TPA: ISAs1 family transposase [Salmonella enterica subsp. enterica serovar Saintpaul]
MWRYLFVQRIIAERKNRKCWVRYYTSSSDLTSEKFANAMRSHWDVENKLHWRLDVAMNEDDCRIRRGNVKRLFEIIKIG